MRIHLIPSWGLKQVLHWQKRGLRWLVSLLLSQFRHGTCFDLESGRLLLFYATKKAKVKD